MIDRSLDILLKEKYDIEFKNRKLLESALSHSSYVHEHPKDNIEDYERLEFLGDAVLELSISEYLFKKYPDMPEGELTRLRADIVRTKSFAQFNRDIGLDQYIQLGKGEEKNGARNRDTLLEDTFEAFNGALYLDQGKDKVVELLNKVVFPKIDEGDFSANMDYKTKLQEVLQQNGSVSIEYEVEPGQSPDYGNEFKIDLKINGKKLSDGRGTNKKVAEQQAAKKALDQLNN